MRFLTRHRWAIWAVFGSYFLLQCILPTAFVLADTDYNSYCVQIGCSYYDPSSTACESSDVALLGKDNEERAWNFFKSKGLGDIPTAAIIGNLMLESHMNPTAVESGGNADSQPTYILEGSNPPHSPGWGLPQWTLPYQDVAKLAQQHDIEGPLYELGTQLNILWAQINSKNPEGESIVNGISKQKDLSSAVDYFLTNFERGAPSPARLSYAHEAFEKYGNSPSGPITNPTTSATSGCASSSLSPDCQTASGVAKILCAAKQYDTVSYSMTIEGGHQGAVEWHKSCPTIGPSCILDCSGLVNIAVYDVYGADLRENTDSEAANTQNWKHISFDELQPGDLVQPHAGHVEIVDHVKGNTIITFGAHSSTYPQPRQVGPSSFPVTSTNIYLHYVGPGSEK